MQVGPENLNKKKRKKMQDDWCDTTEKRVNKT